MRFDGGQRIGTGRFVSAREIAANLTRTRTVGNVTLLWQRLQHDVAVLSGVR